MTPSNNPEKKILSDTLNNSASVYESSGSQLFRTTTGILSKPDVFDTSRLIVTFLTNLGVTEIFCSFRLVLKRKKGKEIPKSLRLQLKRGQNQKGRLWVHETPILEVTFVTLTENSSVVTNVT